MPPKSEKKIKAVKEGPKKNKSSYMFFCEQERKKIKEDKPELGNKDIVVELGVRWKELKEDEDRKDELNEYTKLAEKDKERYLNEKQLKTEKKESDEDEAEEKPVKKAKKTTKKVSKKDEAEVEDEEVEDEEVEEKPKKEVKKKKTAAKKVEKTEEVEVEVEEEDEKPKDKKEKTKVNGYINYTKEMRDKVKKENPKLTPKEVTQQLSKQWKELSDSEKDKFKNK